jgi:DNA-directed RNA polymerase
MNKHEAQLRIENMVTGEAFDANPISDLLSQAFDLVFSRFGVTPRWVKIIDSIGIQKVSFVAVCSLMEYTREEGGVAQAHGVVGAISNRLAMMCELDKKTRCLLAWNILHTCRECGLVNLTTTKKGEPTTVVSLSSLFCTLLDLHNLWGLCGLNRRPMIVPPVPHTMEKSGGYLTRELRKGIANGDWSNIKATPVVDAMNHLQNTSWRINPTVLGVADYLLTPYMEARETNAYSHDTCMMIANELLGMPFWNPTYIDWRGRVGYHADILSPQGNDLSRGLLLYGEDIEISDEGWYWLRVHVANSLSGLHVASGKKLDKMPFDERVAWVDDNLEPIMAIAHDPIGTRELYWDGFAAKAGTFQALAACVEVLTVSRTNRTSLPITLDATCNNYQWFAGLLLDEDMGQRTNLLPCDYPHDLHTDVANENARAWDEGERDHDYIDVFIEHKDKLCDRNVGKGATLVVGYGGKRRGITSRFMGKKYWFNMGNEDEPQWIVSAHPDSPISHIGVPEDEQWKAAFALSGDYETSVYAVAPSALEVTKFLRECVKVCNNITIAMTWLSPSGLLVSNKPTSKVEFNLTASDLFEDQTSTQLKFTVFDKDLNKRKAVSAAPPQYVHSLDGSHLHYSVIDLANYIISLIEVRSIPHISTVHDCYGCHANYVGEMVRIVPNVFAKIIKTKPLEVLAEAYGVECPEFGTLDTELVSQANYFLT